MLTEMRLEECELDCALIGKRVRTARKAKNANPQIKIENNIAPKLKQCDTQMLDMVGSFIDGLITYKESVLSKKDK